MMMMMMMECNCLSSIGRLFQARKAAIEKVLRHVLVVTLDLTQSQDSIQYLGLERYCLDLGLGLLPAVLVSCLETEAILRQPPLFVGRVVHTLKATGKL